MKQQQQQQERMKGWMDGWMDGCSNDTRIRRDEKRDARCIKEMRSSSIMYRRWTILYCAHEMEVRSMRKVQKDLMDPVPAGMLYARINQKYYFSI